MMLMRRLRTGAWTPRAASARTVSPSGRMSAAVAAAAAGRKGRDFAMRRVVLAAAMAGLMASRVLGAGGSISGTYVEARTAEVFAGGCIMNGEAVTTGREALLAWKVTR